MTAPGAAARGFARYRRPLGWAFNLLVLAYAVRELVRLGIGDVLHSLPVQPAFYLVYLLQFAATPLSERLLYRLTWADQPRIPWLVLVRKRVMNAVLLSYSGEVWFVLWARAHLTLSARWIAATVKDSSIVSGIALAVGSILLAAWAMTTARGAVIADSVAEHIRIILVVAIGAACTIPILYRWRRRIFALPGAMLAGLFALHSVRLAVTLALQALQWMVVMPQVGFDVWLLFLTVQLLVIQIPLVPNADLLFLAVGVRLTADLGVARADLAALLLATTVFKQIVNLACLALTSVTTPAGRRAA